MFIMILNSDMFAYEINNEMENGIQLGYGCVMPIGEYEPTVDGEETVNIFIGG